jgi:hypothetical protein
MNKKEIKKQIELSLEDLDQVTGGAGSGGYIESISDMEDNRLRWSTPTPTPAPAPAPAPIASKPSC